MVKLVSIFSLKPGTDPDEANQAWHDQHASWIKDKILPEAKKYTTNRVVHKYAPAGGTVAEFDIYGYEMSWFEDLAAALKAAERWRSAQPDSFLTGFVSTHKMVIVAEEPIEL
jgi:hypothetical protein